LCWFGYFAICSDDELHDLPEESLLYSPQKTDPKLAAQDDRPKNEIVSACSLLQSFILLGFMQ